MKRTCTLVLASVLALLWSPAPAESHGSGGGGGPQPPPVVPAGGTYTGPKDYVPPGGGGQRTGGGATSTGGGQPSGPTARPKRPASTGGGGQGPQQGGPSSPQSAGGGVDLASWRFWWRYNRNPYLDLKNRLAVPKAVTGSEEFYLGRGEGRRAAGARPGALRVHGEVSPALRELLETERTSHLLTSAMLALSKFGEDPDERGAPTLDLFRPLLSHGNIKVAEVSALSCGILGRPEAAATLSHLLLNDAAGQELCDSSRVPARVRAFSAYALGVLGQRLEREDLRRFIVSTLTRAFESDGTFDVEVACLLALGLVPLQPTLDDDGHLVVQREDVLPTRGRQDQVAWCLGILERDERGYLVQAHVPTTVGRLLADVPGDDPGRVDAVERLLDLIGPRSKASTELRQSAAQALGRLADADDDRLDAKVRAALTEVQEHEADRLVRGFALMSLAQIGGRPGQGSEPLAGTGRVRSFLARTLARGKSFAQPWAALSIGVLERSLFDAGHPVSDDLLSALRAALEAERSPELAGALCIALGIARDAAAAETLVEKLDRLDPDTRGYAVLALGMIAARESLEELEGLLERSKYRPQLVWSTAVAMALMRDAEVVARLVGMLEKSSSLITRGGVCFALGHVGDASAVTALLDLSRDEDTPDVARGIAVEALGIVGERDALPWNTRLSVGTNYAANPATLSGSSTPGVLDLF